jgi:hypothetical protein
MTTTIIIKIAEFLAPVALVVALFSSWIMNNYLRQRNINIPFSGVHLLEEIYAYVDETRKETGRVGPALKSLIMSFVLFVVLIIAGLIASLL